jgi:hypothetical protein
MWTAEEILAIVASDDSAGIYATIVTTIQSRFAFTPGLRGAF